MLYADADAHARAAVRLLCISVEWNIRLSFANKEVLESILNECLKEVGNQEFLRTGKKNSHILVRKKKGQSVCESVVDEKMD